MDSIAADLARYGVPLVGLNVLLQQLGLPIPAVPTMMLAGALALSGRIDLPAAFAIAVAASLIADLLWFSAGRRYGYRVLRFLCRISLSPDTCVRETEGIFDEGGRGRPRPGHRCRGRRQPRRRPRRRQPHADDLAAAAAGAAGTPATAADATILDRSAYDVVFLDPARRTARGRIFDVDAYSPPWSFVEALLAGPARLREGRPGHPARPGPRTAWRPSGSASTARSRRPRSGRRTWPRSPVAPP